MVVRRARSRARFAALLLVCVFTGAGQRVLADSVPVRSAEIQHKDEIQVRLTAATERTRAACRWTLVGQQTEDTQHFNRLATAMREYLELIRVRTTWPESVRHSALGEAIAAEQSNLVLAFADVRSWQTRYAHECGLRPAHDVANAYCLAVDDMLARLTAALGRISAAATR
jgi:hypothetical protein